MPPYRCALAYVNSDEVPEPEAERDTDPESPFIAAEVMLGDGFPVSARDHGTEFATVDVGIPTAFSKPQTFHIHKNLLIKASTYYSVALGKNFAEARTNQIELQWADSAAFEVLYQYLYSGRVFLPKFYTKLINSDVLWLWTFKIAHGTVVQSLLNIAYDRIRELLNDKASYVPTKTFIRELYDDEAPLNSLRDFVVAHTAYWIHTDSRSDWARWTATMGESVEFGGAVACQLAKLHSKRYEGSKVHPIKDNEFDHVNFFNSEQATEDAASEAYTGNLNESEVASSSKGKSVARDDMD